MIHEMPNLTTVSPVTSSMIGSTIPWNYNYPMCTHPISWVPSPEIFKYPGVLDSIIEKLATTVKPGEKIVVCVDMDVSWEQCHEIEEGLIQFRVPAVIIKGARAGTGFLDGFQPKTTEERRVDVLARIGEVWAQRPDLKLTELLSWYNGGEMDDEDFASACEVNFLKVTNGAYRL
jgi:hypothetical protein